MKNLLHIIISGLLLFLTLGVNTSFAQNCGPGPHWVDNCPGGVDSMGSVALAGISLNPSSCDPSINLILSGYIRVRRQASTDIAINDSLNCSATVDGHTDVIPTEILSLVLTGGGYTLIAGQSAAPELRPSLGNIVELAGDSTKACSYFHVFFKVIRLSDGATLYNHDSLRVQATIDSVPPMAVYEHITKCIRLYDSPTGGTHVANLVAAKHYTTPVNEPTFASQAPTRILNSFQGVYAENSKSVSISWQIPSETNNTFYLFERDDNFYIERSRDGVNFKKIGTVRRGSANTTNYTFTDPYPIPLGYYRLQFISSGGLSHSQIITVASVTGGRLSISPNPSSGKIKLLLKNMQLSAVDVTVYDMYGHLVLSQRIRQGGQPEINISGLSNGTYLLQCRQNGVIYQGKLFKK